jgi:hypothetical protein
MYWKFSARVQHDEKDFWGDFMLLAISGHIGVRHGNALIIPKIVTVMKWWKPGAFLRKINLKGSFTIFIPSK